jgi:hypothetical protein
MKLFMLHQSVFLEAHERAEDGKYDVNDSDKNKEGKFTVDGFQQFGLFLRLGNQFVFDVQLLTAIFYLWGSILHE